MPKKKNFAFACLACGKPFLTVPKVRGHFRRSHGEIVNPKRIARRIEVSDEMILALRGKRGQGALWYENAGEP